MRIEGNIQLNRGEWEALFNELLSSDSERVQATRNFFEHIDRDISVSSEGGSTFVRSASLDVSGLRAAISQRRNRSNSICRRYDAEIVVRSQQNYARRENMNVAYNVEVGARKDNWENEIASTNVLYAA